jgi:hypothetical protein
VGACQALARRRTLPAVKTVHLMKPVGDQLVPACGARGDEAPPRGTALAMCEACRSVVRARLAALASDLGGEDAAAARP